MSFQMSEVVNRTFNTVGKNAATFFGMSALLVGVPALIVGLVTYFSVSGTTDSYMLMTAVTAIGSIVGLVTGYILQGALTEGSIRSFDNREITFGNTISKGLSVALPLIGMGLLVGLGVMIGFLALIIPGIFLLLIWSVAVPTKVVEGIGIMDALQRSRELTKGHRWAIFGLYVAFVLLALGFGFLFGLLATPFMAMGSFGLMIGSLLEIVASVITAVISGVGVTSLYFELRKAKEGIGSEALADVFN